MKKVFTLFAAMALLVSASFAQKDGREPQTRRVMPVTRTLQKPITQTVSPKSAGDTIATFPWTESFDATTLPTGFTSIDADGDGYNWDCTYWNVNGGQISSPYAHTGDGMIASASYINDVGALTPDNWLILPAFDIPSDAEYELTWYEADYSYQETYTVYITTAGNTTANFTAGAATTFTTNGQAVSFVKRTIDLSNYAGQIVHIAFRHYNVTDMYWLFIDDIRIGGPSAPEITVNGPANLREGDTAIFTVTSTSTNITWDFTADYTSFNGDTAIAVWNTAGTYNVIAEATNIAGTTYDTLEVTVIACDAIATFPYVQDFEDVSDLLCWATVDADGDGYTWTFDYLREDGGYGYNGSDGMAASASYNQSALTPDNWLILPAIDLTNETDLVLSWFAKAQDDDYADEYYSVYISTTGGSVSNFTNAVYSGMPTGDWNKYAVDLSSYSGEIIYVAFRHYNCTDMFYLDIDNIRIGSQEAPFVTLDGETIVRTTDPVVFTATSDATDFEWAVDGTILPNETNNTLTYTFTTAGIHIVKVSATNTIGTTSDSISVEVIDCSDAIELPHTFNLATDFNLCWDNPEEGWDILEDETTGEGYLYSMSNIYGIFDLDPDNWVYTPTLAMPANGSFDIAWKVAPYTTQLPSDHYGVYVVQGTNATLLREETLDATMDGFQQRVVSIPSTVTGEFKIAFRHFETTGGYVILIGDLKVVASGTIEGIDNANAANISLYPNPTNDILNVEGEGINEIQLMDVNGRTVMTTAATRQLDLRGLAAGVYMIRVITNEGTTTQKIVKK